MNHIVIDCEDIYLREYRVEDLDAIHSITHETEIIEFLPGWNVPKEQRLNWLQNYETIENNQFLQAVAEGEDIGELRLRLGIISKQADEFIGWCCTGLKDEIPSPNREIVFGISNKHANKGYTTQASKGLISYLFENTNVEELIALALVRNIPSKRVIIKSGFQFQNTIEIENEKYNLYRLSKSVWKK